MYVMYGEEPTKKEMNAHKTLIFTMKNMSYKNKYGLTLATAAFYFRESSLSSASSSSSFFFHFPQCHCGQWIMAAAQHRMWLIPLVKKKKEKKM